MIKGVFWTGVVIFLGSLISWGADKMINDPATILRSIGVWGIIIGLLLTTASFLK